MADNGIAENSLWKLRNSINAYTAENKDLYYIHLKCRGEIESLSTLKKKETEMLRRVVDGTDRHYKQMVFGIKKKVDIQKVFEKYTEVVNEIQALRTCYIYRGIEKPAKVVYEKKDAVFPVTDISGMADKEKMILVKNVLAGESRREYNPEQDFVLRLQALMVNNQNMLVIASQYMGVELPVGAKDIVIRIFGSLGFLDDLAIYANDEQVRDINQSLVAKCEDYWKGLAPFGKELKIPGELSVDRQIIGKRGVLYKSVDQAVYDRLTEYCCTAGVSTKAVILSAWGVLLGAFNNEEHPVLAMMGKGENMRLFPVRIDSTKTLDEQVRAVSGQMQNTYENSACPQEFIDSLAGKKTEEYFHAVFSFIEFEEHGSSDVLPDIFMQLDGGAYRENDVGIEICCRLLGEEFSINYTYDSKRLYETLVENLHTLFVRILDSQLRGINKKFDKEEYIRKTDTNEEKLRKLEVAQNVLYLKESGYFDGCTAEGYMAIAERVRVENYLCNDTAIEEGQAVCEIGIVVAGSMEECLTGRDGLVRTLRVVYPSAVIGMEGLFDENVSHFTYSGMGDNNKVLWIDRDTMLGFLNSVPDNWRKLLEHTFKDGMKAKKLWSME